jgi:hypothetical protein
MAISLKDVKKSKKGKKEGIRTLKDKVLRPWQGYEELGSQTRTLAAREAVKNAKLIVQKNNVWVDNLKKRSYKPLEEECSESQEIQMRLKVYKVYRFKKLTGLFWYIRNIIGRL